jgi:hypothetical protein
VSKQFSVVYFIKRDPKPVPIDSRDINNCIKKIKNLLQEELEWYRKDTSLEYQHGAFCNILKLDN